MMNIWFAKGGDTAPSFPDTSFWFTLTPENLARYGANVISGSDTWSFFVEKANS